MTNNKKQGFELKQLLLKKKKKVPSKMLEDTYINQLAIKTKLYPEENIEDLIVVTYIACNVAKKIKNALKTSYIPYCSEEDFLSLFYLAVQKSVNEYEPDKGNFSVFLATKIDNAFKNEKKSGFLKVTGNISKEKRTETKSVPVQNYEIGKKNSFQIETETELMNEQLITSVSKIEYGYLLLYKYTKSDKPISNKELAEIFGLTERQVRTRLKKAADTFVAAHNSFYEDYYYDTDNIDTNISVQTA